MDLTQRMHLLRWHEPRRFLWGRERSRLVNAPGWSTFHIGWWYIETCPLEAARSGAKPLYCWKAWR